MKKKKRMRRRSRRRTANTKKQNNGPRRAHFEHDGHKLGVTQTTVNISSQRAV